MEQMGIIQFFSLAVIILVYLAIVGGLIARVVVRSANEIKNQAAPEPEQAMLRG
jgi:hypothetical protein